MSLQLSATENAISNDTDNNKRVPEHLEQYPNNRINNEIAITDTENEPQMEKDTKENPEMLLSKTATEDNATDQQITVDVPESPTESSYVNIDEIPNLDLDTEGKTLSRSSVKDDDKDVQLTTIDEPKSEKQYFGLSGKSLDESSRDDTDSTQGTQVKEKELAGIEFFHSPSSDSNKDEYVFTGKNKNHETITMHANNWYKGPRKTDLQDFFLDRHFNLGGGGIICL